MPPDTQGFAGQRGAPASLWCRTEAQRNKRMGVTPEPALTSFPVCEQSGAGPSRAPLVARAVGWAVGGGLLPCLPLGLKGAKQHCAEGLWARPLLRSP